MNIRKSYTYLVYLTYFFYILIFLGIWNQTIYLSLILDIIRVFVTLFLIIRFNPFSKHKFNDLDKKIAFHAGLLLFSLASISAIFTNLPIVNKDIVKVMNTLFSSSSSSS